MCRRFNIHYKKGCFLFNNSSLHTLVKCISFCANKIVISFLLHQGTLDRTINEKKIFSKFSIVEFLFSLAAK